MILLNKFLADERVIFNPDEGFHIKSQSFFVNFKSFLHAMYGYGRAYKKYDTYVSMDHGYDVWCKKRIHVGVYINFSSNMTITVKTGWLFLTSKDYSETFEYFINELINAYKIMLSI